MQASFAFCNENDESDKLSINNDDFLDSNELPVDFSKS